MMKLYSGFSLVEVLIVMLILGVLSSIAYPSYQHHRSSVNRTEAKLALSAFAVAMDSHYSREGSYVTAALGGAGKQEISSPVKASIFSDTAPLDRANKLYLLRIVEADAFHYILQAIPMKNKTMAGDGFFQLDSFSMQAWDKDASGSIDVTEWCWEATSCG